MITGINRRTKWEERISNGVAGTSLQVLSNTSQRKLVKSDIGGGVVMCIV